MILTALSVASLCVWLYLFFAHGRFWCSTPELLAALPLECPDLDIVVPARDEAATIGAVIASLVSQQYAGRFNVILVDDNSSDGTAALAGTAPNLRVMTAPPKPDGWSGKLWALNHGIAASRAPLLLFVDADIVHDARHVSTLVARLNAPRVRRNEPNVDLVSEMVRLNCTSFAERALVPAFVYFFQMLYPFAKVNDSASTVAAAAGGTVLIRREALERIGGLASIKGALIDDVTLARAVKRGGAVYLGHSSLARSIRPYPHLIDLWRMISRTAFTQLRYSAGLLVLTVFGLTLVWGVPVGTAVFGHGRDRYCGLAAFTLSAVSYLPTLARYRSHRAWALALPLIAVFYLGATLESAVTHWRGAGARWKNRDYGKVAP